MCELRSAQWGHRHQQHRNFLRPYVVATRARNSLCCPMCVCSFFFYLHPFYEHIIMSSERLLRRSSQNVRVRLHMRAHHAHKRSILFHFAVCLLVQRAHNNTMKKQPLLSVCVRAHAKPESYLKPEHTRVCSRAARRARVLVSRMRLATASKTGAKKEVFDGRDDARHICTQLFKIYRKHISQPDGRSSRAFTLTIAAVSRIES